MTLRIPAKVLLHVWSYDFYDMTLSTGEQRRHMINSGYSLEPPPLGFDKKKYKKNIETLLLKFYICYICKTSIDSMGKFS